MKITSYSPLLIFIVLLAFLILTPSAGFGQRNNANQNALLTEKTFKVTVMKKLPQRGDLDEQDISDLMYVLNELEIYTEKDLNDLFKEYLKPALKEDKRICREILKNYKESGDLYSDDSFVVEEDDLDQLKKGRYFAPAGIVRQMLIIKFGEEYDDLIRGNRESDFDSEDDDWEDEDIDEISEEEELVLKEV